MNYIMQGIANLRSAVLTGVPIYIVIFAVLYFLKNTEKISWNCVFEMIFCIYSVMLLETVGLLSLKLNFDGMVNFNLIPFIGSSFVPVVLNFLLFIPYGFLLPLVFSSWKWNGKKILCVGAITSFSIEVLQMFGGRYAEIDDFLMNTLGTFSGYIFYRCLWMLKKNRKRAICMILSLAAALTICFAGIYAAGDHTEYLPDGFMAVQNDVSEVFIYSRGEKQAIGVYSDIYSCFEVQMSNCGGHLMEAENVSENEVMNDTDCFIEVLYTQPQTITFQNVESFVISNADRVLYNSNTNILYWGNGDYQYCVNYTKMEAELKEFEAELLEEYKRLQMMIMNFDGGVKTK